MTDDNLKKMPEDMEEKLQKPSVIIISSFHRKGNKG